MRRRTLIGALGLAPPLLSMLNPRFARAAAERPLPAIGSRLELVDAPLLEGGSFRAAEAEGHAVIVYWWASWCPFCAIQNPYMQKLWDAQQPRGLRMIAVSIDTRIDDALRYRASRGYSFPSTIVAPAIEPVLSKPTRGLPVTVVRGRDGRVVMAEPGQMFPEDVEAIARFV